MNARIAILIPSIVTAAPLDAGRRTPDVYHAW